ncbi:MAG: hypothetical protein MPN21_07800 [Thermoanaerobaculia bacterium]|nr:hypothetical protein [Thermoanaerobaculia bacterium]
MPAGIRNLLWLLGVLLTVPAFGQSATEHMPAIRPLRTQGLPMELAALLLSGQQGGPVPFEILPMVMPTGGDQGQVIVVFDIDALAFQLPPTATNSEAVSPTESTCGGTRKVEIMLYATAEGGAVRDSLLQTFEVDTHRLNPCLLDAGARFVGRLELPSGDVSLRSLVRVGGEHVGLRVTPLHVGPGGRVVTGVSEQDSAGAWLSPPLVMGLADDRPVLYEVTGSGAPVTEPPPGLGGVPAADPVVRRDETVQVKVLAADLDRIGSEWRAVIQDEGGKILGQVPAKLAYGPSEGNVRVLEMEFDTVGFPVGTMMLSLQSGNVPSAQAADNTSSTPESLGRPAWREQRHISTMRRAETDSPQPSAEPSGLTVTPTIRLTVVADRAAAFTTDLLADLPEDHDPTAAQARRAATEVARQALPALRDALDVGDWGAARDGVTQLAAQVGAAYGQEGLNQLGRETLEMFGGDRLLPVAVLHYDAYREARRLRDFLVSTYAREIIVAAIRSLEEDPRVSSTLAADFYAFLGVQLQSAGLVRFSTAMLQRAIELEPRQSAARLSVAINYEQLGLTEDAARSYEELLEMQPTHEIAALRRAIALRRLARGRAASTVLESLVERAREPWIRSVAFQELAMERLNAEGPPAARDLLRRAIRELPREPRLYLQLAFVLDALGQREAAAAVLEDMKLRTAPGAGYTPRHRLTQWNSDATAELESRLRGLANESLASLQRTGGGAAAVGSAGRDGGTRP